ncbi:MAG: outer membrane protein assembly factor BamD [Chlamydiae bacterium]|nr:outer membrane protein assembly factor BamD [Chlamydiota bacterium]
MIKYLTTSFLLLATCLFAGKSIEIEKPALAFLEKQACHQFNEKKYEQAIGGYQKIIRYYPASPAATKAYYFMGIGYYYLRDYDLSNKSFTCYLEKDSLGTYFEHVMSYKFAIAEAFRKGECVHLFGARHLPKWLCADNEAIEIYDEIISVMPGQELAVCSLWGKGSLLLRSCQYKEGRESLQTLVVAFPRHPLAIESYLEIACSYLKECEKESGNSDLLSLSAINIKKFQQAFPSEPRVKTAEKMHHQMQECYAASIYEMAEFYERTCHPDAARIYYKAVLRDFPSTSYAKYSSRAIYRLEKGNGCS